MEISKEVWQEVLKELAKNPMYRGKYDAKHGSIHFMHGISTVMEDIAYRAEMHIGFTEEFAKNLVESRAKKNGNYKLYR